MILHKKVKESEQISDSKREVGRYTQNHPGPCLVCFAGVHGNEPTGVVALQKVLSELNSLQPVINGSFIGLAGNLAALSKGVRFIHKDFNRVWGERQMQKVTTGYENLQENISEYHEQQELYNSIHQIIGSTEKPKYFIDLHTTSSISQPFITINDTIRNRNFSLEYPLPIVLGIEEFIEGTILSYINEIGHIAIGFEAGQHKAQLSIDNHEAFIWLSLINSGCIDRSEIRNADLYYDQLASNTTEKNKVFEVRHKYNIHTGEAFKMEPGYINFQSITRNEKVAANQAGNIKAKETGKIFMPLYQTQGKDGFFIIRQIKWFWLKVSQWLRKRNYYKLLLLLPGIKKYDGIDNAIIVNTGIAKWYVIDLFHLLGFRRKKYKKNRVIFIKRKYDFHGPP